MHGKRVTKAFMENALVNAGKQQLALGIAPCATVDVQKHSKINKGNLIVGMHINEQLDRTEARARDSSKQNVGKWRLHKYKRMQTKPSRSGQKQGRPSCEGTHAGT
jgi:hypothetical protein